MFGSSLESLELSSLHVQPVLEASGKTLQPATVRGGHPRRSAGQENLALHDNGSTSALGASPQSFLVLDIDGAGVVASQRDQHFDGCAGQPSTSEASTDHTQLRSFEVVSIASADAQTTFQEAGERQSLCMGKLDRDRAAVKQWRERQTKGVGLRHDFFDTQLKRFLSLLVQADSRLMDSKVGHRIQLVDCRLTQAGQLGSWSEAVYSQLTAILQQMDSWEQRLQRVEDFVAVNGGLPMQRGTDSTERLLAHWLSRQGRIRKRGQLLESRLQRLLNSPSTLLQQRVEGWLSKDQDCSFKRWCEQLKQYVERQVELPPRGHALWTWLRTQRHIGTLGNQRKREMLESAHPLVAELLAKWDHSPLRIKLPKWQAQLHKLVNFVKAEGRMPGTTSSLELAAYKWFAWQVRRLQQLPNELLKQLRKSHPLIAAAVKAKEGQESAA